MAKQQPKLSLSDQIRQAVETCGESRYSLAKKTGISESMFSRFMAGDRGLSMKALDVLAEYLGLEIKVKREKRSGSKQDRKES